MNGSVFGPIQISMNRLLTGAIASVFVLVAGIAGQREIAAHSPGMAVFLIVFFGAVAVVYGRWTFERGPRLVIDETGITDVRRARLMPWADIASIALLKRQRPFGEFHSLRVAFREPATPSHIDLRIDMLSMRWPQIVELVAERSGRPVQTRRQGFRDEIQA